MRIKAAVVAGGLVMKVWSFMLNIRLSDFHLAEGILKTGRYILAGWHARILVPAFFFKDTSLAAMVSASRDGEFVAGIIERQGKVPVRGSSTRGGARAMVALITKMKKENMPAAIIPDGPQGPRHYVKPGVIRIAQKTGCPIIPVSYSASRITRLNSWDRFIIPWPLSSCLIVFGSPIFVQGSLTAAEFEYLRATLEEELMRITRKADQTFGHRLDY